MQDTTELCFCVVPRRARRRVTEPNIVCGKCAFEGDGETLTWNPMSSGGNSGSGSNEDSDDAMAEEDTTEPAEPEEEATEPAEGEGEEVEN